MKTYGELVRILDNRIELSPKMLEPIGIFPGSPISGIYLPSTEKDRSKPAFLHRHDLLFTPIHYKVWPFVARIATTLNHDIGSIRLASEIFAKMGVNILYAEANRAGHQYAVWNVVGEFEEIKQKHYVFLRELTDYSGPNSDGVRNQLKDRLEQIEKAVIGQCKRIKKRLESLSPDVVYQNTNVRSCDYQYLSSLAHFYTHQIYNAAFQGKCDKPGRLAFGEAKAQDRLGGFRNLDFPAIGFATTDIDDFTIRVSVIEQSYLDRFIEMKVRYSRNRIGRNISSTRGFLNSISEAVSDNEINMWRIYNSFNESSLDRELGFIHAYAETKTVLGESVIRGLTMKLLSDIENNNSRLPGGQRVKIDDLKITRLRSKRIFVSFKMDFPRRKDLVTILNEVAREFGIPADNLINVQEVIESVSATVIQEVQNCDAMLCIFAGNTAKKDLDYSWLEIEFVLAQAFKKRVVRIVDTSIKKRPKFQKDIAPLEFNLQKDNDDVIKDVVRQAFFEILKER